MRRTCAPILVWFCTFQRKMSPTLMCTRSRSSASILACVPLPLPCTPMITYLRMSSAWHKTHATVAGGQPFIGRRRIWPRLPPRPGRPGPCSRCSSRSVLPAARHSWRALAIQRSAIAFARGAWTGVWMIRTPVALNTASNAAVNFVSRSRIRNFRPSAWPSRSISRLRACWVTHAPAGWAVMPARCTRRVPCSMKNSTYRRRSNTVSTWKKSVARIVLACPARNARQVCPSRLGAESMPASLKDLPHRRRRQLIAQAGQLAVDAPVAPGRVVLRHLQDQRAYGSRRARPSRSARRV